MSPYWNNFPESRPRQAKGGIKSRSQRGEFGESWWARRWMQTLESFDIGARLGRGRSYARKGQVVSITIDKGLVTAQVQGSRPTPYSVRIAVKELTPAHWKKLIKSLSTQAVYTARLLAGTMPEDIESVFAQAGVSLFPERSGDLETDCNCPDWSNPCKHIAAVYYLIGEEFDRDPFLIFRLRGLDRDELMRKLMPSGAVPAALPEAPPRPDPVALRADPDSFWGAPDLYLKPPGDLRIPPVDAALPRGLGGFPFWRADDPMPDVLEPIYAAASRHVLQRAIESEEEGMAGRDEG